MRAFTVSTLAREWHCSEGSIRKLIANSELGCFRLGTLIRIPAEEVARFECQNIPSSGSEADTPSSIETRQECGIGNAFEPAIVLGLRRKRGEAGEPEKVRRGPWAGS